MITKTLNLDDAYQKVFDEIREKTDGALDINKIEDFFGNLLEITALDKKYLRLPVDEPMFAIDANSRKINIPNEFRTNGLSVQGDHLAETVFFSIDRYFDYMDLSTCDVVINWKMGTETGKTNKFIMSTDIMPGYIVFGWPINNVITEKSGSLTFAVEFNKPIQNSEIPYSFNTLPATINIKDGLIIKDVEAVSLDNDILSILTDSKFGEGDAVVGDIRWLTGEGHGLVRGTGPATDVVLSDYSSTINLTTNIDENGLPYSVPAMLYAEAFVDVGTKINYMDSLGHPIEAVMSKVPLNLIKVEGDVEVGKTYYSDTGEILTNEELMDAEEVYEVGPVDPALKYYVLIESEESTPAYRLATEDEIANRNVDLYINLAGIEVSTAGSCIIKAQGQKYDTNGKKIGAGAAVACDPIIIPEVEIPSAINIEKSTATLVDDDNYSFDTEESENVVFLGEDGGLLKASAVLVDPNALQFIWKKQTGVTPKNKPIYTAISEEAVPFQFENSSDFIVEEEGTYVVDVSHFKNGQTSAPVQSNPIIASQLAGKITSASISYKPVNANTEFTPLAFEGNKEDLYIDSNSITQVKKYQLRFDDCVIDGVQGDISYEWYRGVTIQEEDSVFFSSNQVLDIPAGDYCYFAKIKNKYNGSIYTYSFKPIQINDQGA